MLTAIVSARGNDVAAQIGVAELERWMPVGHSMGAKVAAAIARPAEDGVEGLHGLVGLVSLAGSPPSPEPMEESKRQTMLGWFRNDRATAQAEAETYLRENLSQPLTPEVTRLAVDDVLHAHPAAWLAWLTAGSREDLRAHIGVLRTPTLIVAGADDKALGEAAQRQFALPHYSNVRSHCAERRQLKRRQDLKSMCRGRQ